MNPNKQHPGGDEDDLRRLAEVYRRHEPPAPAPEAWDRTLAAIEAAGRRPSRPARWPWAAAAAAIVALVLAYHLLPSWEPPAGPAVVELPPEDQGGEPFPVASAGEVHVLSVSAEDADRLAVGQRLMGEFEVAAPGEIEIVRVEPNPEDGRTPVMQPNAAMPLIVVSAEEP